MFAPRYFAPNYFAPRYWPPGTDIIETPEFPDEPQEFELAMMRQGQFILRVNQRENIDLNILQLKEF